MKKSPLILLAALFALAMALTACGGGSSSSGGGESAIEEAIETSATSSDPSKCSEVQTQAFNEAETEKKGEAALKTCEEEAEAADSEPAESVTVSNISENGDTATAEVAITGGSLEGQSVELELADEDGDWKLNKFLSFTKYDPAGIAAVMEEKLPEQEGVTPALAKCIAEGVEEMSQAEAEKFVFEKNVEGIEEIAAGCNQ